MKRFFGNFFDTNNKNTTNTMKKLSLFLITAGLVWTVQTVDAQSVDTTKNKVEVKKKVREKADGTTVTKVKMTGKGTPTAIKDPASNATSSPSEAKPAAPAVVTPAPAVVVVRDTVHNTVSVPVPVPVIVRDTVRPKTTTTEVTTTTETRPVVKTTATTRVSATKKPYRKPATTARKTTTKTALAAPVAKVTTTTTTVKKTE
ncbi:hypothetical protein ACFQZS_17995 [Mucilaginibacter calamicampi]|uniref:Uncharacterized protein n=2 Tax=Mucilaginibacter calamicampi TaxID=1302352 RepID=A0ABW2Z2U8_9SPHI